MLETFLLHIAEWDHVTHAACASLIIKRCIRLCEETKIYFYYALHFLMEMYKYYFPYDLWSESFSLTMIQASPQPFSPFNAKSWSFVSFYSLHVTCADKLLSYESFWSHRTCDYWVYECYRYWIFMLTKQGRESMLCRVINIFTSWRWMGVRFATILLPYMSKTETSFIRSNAELWYFNV